MKGYEKWANDWLVENDWDYHKYGDRRPDRSAYDGMMNYEISSVLFEAFEAGFKCGRGHAANLIDGFKNPKTDGLAILVRSIGEDVLSTDEVVEKKE